MYFEFITVADTLISPELFQSSSECGNSDRSVLLNGNLYAKSYRLIASLLSNFIVELLNICSIKQPARKQHQFRWQQSIAATIGKLKPTFHYFVTV